jgi:hypothetical protein
MKVNNLCKSAFNVGGNFDERTCDGFYGRGLPVMAMGNF